MYSVLEKALKTVSHGDEAYKVNKSPSKNIKYFFKHNKLLSVFKLIVNFIQFPLNSIRTYDLRNQVFNNNIIITL